MKGVNKIKIVIEREGDREIQRKHGNKNGWKIEF